MSGLISTWRSILLAVMCMVLALTTTAMAGDEDKFPLRKKWPNLVPISTQELAAARSKKEAIVVDVRTAAEYEIMNIAGSHHIPHDKIGVGDDPLRSLTENPYSVLVFYCNGTTCAKSYKAADMAALLGHKGVRVYDGGIFEWAETYPAETIFFGRRMTKELVKQYVVNEEDFDKGPWLVNTLEFIDLAKSGNYHVVDLRERRERTEYPIQLPNLNEATVDQLARSCGQENFPKTRVLVFDNVGKQIIWAKYYLDRCGVKDYFFLRGGVLQWRADGRDGKGDKSGKVFGRPAPK